jgi:hypothetical protein
MKDRENNSEYEDQIEDEEAGELADEPEELPAVVPDRPTCPSCGWHNTRPSHTKSILDPMLRIFALRPYRCRSCGNRFRVIRRGRRESSKD